MNDLYNAKVSASNFQFLFDLGLRMNLARPKKKTAIIPLSMAWNWA
ncbi:outer membrane protein family protein [Helicobacter pylori R32b]|nr:outer membrane protein family protein [Helicobacter pylori R32b]